MNFINRSSEISPDAFTTDLLCLREATQSSVILLYMQNLHSLYLSSWSCHSV